MSVCHATPQLFVSVRTALIGTVCRLPRASLVKPSVHQISDNRQLIDSLLNLISNTRTDVVDCMLRYCAADAAARSDI